MLVFQQRLRQSIQSAVN